MYKMQKYSIKNDILLMKINKIDLCLTCVELIDASGFHLFPES